MRGGKILNYIERKKLRKKHNYRGKGGGKKAKFYLNKTKW